LKQAKNKDNSVFLLLIRIVSLEKQRRHFAARQLTKGGALPRRLNSQMLKTREK